MKRSTFRKSSLISSVALLLVAIVALSGATFAWFSASNQATASGVDVTSAAGGGLQISEDGQAWGSSVLYTNSTEKGRSATLNPASSAFTNVTAPKFFTGVSDDTANYEVNSKGFSEVSLGGYVNKYDLYAKSIDAGKITVTPAFGDGSGYGRIAIVNETTGALVYYYRAADDNVKAPVKAVGELDTAFETTNAAAITTSTDAKEIATLTSTANQVKFSIYVWYEGQDVDCTSVMSADAFKASFTFNLVK